MDDIVTIRPRGRPRQATCMRDHPLSGDNVYTSPTGERRCKRCQHDRHVAWRAANRARWAEIKRATRMRAKGASEQK